MSKMPRRRYTVIAVLVIVALTVFPTVISADHSWGNYHWARTSNPFTLQLGDNVSGDWEAALSTASTDWTESLVLNTTIVPGGGRPKNCRPTLGRVEVCNASYGNNGWLGMAQIWLTGGHISQGTTRVNDTYFNKPPYNTSAWRNMVMCQEIGHDFGLDHQDENFSNANLGTCMDYTNDPSTNQHPNDHDYAQLVAIYAHLDSTSTVGAVSAMPAAMRDGDFSAPGSWGKLISAAHNARDSVYVRDFGKGNMVVTFVIWIQ